GVRRSTSTARTPARCAGSSSTTRCAGCATSTSTPCGSTRSTRSSTTPPGTCSPSRPTPSPHSRARPAGRCRPPRRPTAMTAQWDDDVHHALHARLTGERHGYYVSFGDTQTLRRALTEVFVHAGTWSEFRGRVWGAPVPAEVDARRFVVFSANHDQVGNRA